MGLFDLFKKKSTAPEHSRDHHYYLAHYGLRYTAHNNPLMYIALLGSEEAPEFLKHIFQQVCESVPDPGVKPHFDASDLKIHCMNLEGFPVAIVEMPPAKMPGEAHFTAFVGLFDPNGDAAPDRETVRGRYLTLEVGQTIEGQARTVLGEWTDDESHLNYGTGPEPDLSKFRGHIQALLRKR